MLYLQTHTHTPSTTHTHTSAHIHTLYICTKHSPPHTHTHDTHTLYTHLHTSTSYIKKETIGVHCSIGKATPYMTTSCVQGTTHFLRHAFLAIPAMYVLPSHSLKVTFQSGWQALGTKQPRAARSVPLPSNLPSF